MKYLIFLALLISIPLEVLASPHQCFQGNNKKFLHTQDGFISMNYIPKIKDSIIEKETLSLRLIADMVSELNSLASSIEANPKAKPNKQIINDISTSLINYINIQLNFRKSIAAKSGNFSRNNNNYTERVTRRDQAKNHGSRCMGMGMGRGRIRDSVGLSIYISTFELYNIFQKPDTYRIHKREITSKHSEELEKLNRTLISSLKNYETAYYTSDNYKKEADQYIVATQQALLFLSETYASKILKLDKLDLNTITAKRKLILNAVLDDATANVENLKKFLDLKNNNTKK